MPYYIDSEDLKDPRLMAALRRNLEVEDYWNDSWSTGLYADLAYEGFLSITANHPDLKRPVLLSQLQTHYAVLNWEHLHISRHVRKMIKSSRKWTLTLNRDFLQVLLAIQRQHFRNWLIPEYADLLMRLSEEESFCRPLSVELYSEAGELVAGEVGYTIGRTYTSLSGFSSRKKEHANTGTLQLVLLAGYLQAEGFLFWNLGHPYMEYKTRLGAEILPRRQFLNRWEEARDETLIGLGISG